MDFWVSLMTTAVQVSSWWMMEYVTDCYRYIIVQFFVNCQKCIELIYPEKIGVLQTFEDIKMKGNVCFEMFFIALIFLKSPSVGQTIILTKI